MSNEYSLKRTISLPGAISVGVGGIVGGGILALAGTAFAVTGPSAIIAFALNGVIAMLTALTFAEISSTFPESGGPYLFSKKVFSIQSAFIVGWIVLFAAIVASVLYAIGIGSFSVVVLNQLWISLIGEPPGFLTSSWMKAIIGILATVFYTLSFMRSKGGSEHWSNIIKVICFSILIAGGLWALTGISAQRIGEALTPFFTGDAKGFFKAMGFTFVAFHGFELISFIGGEVKNPEKNLPRSMIISLLIAILIYIPVLFLITVVGVTETETVSQLGREYPETIIAVGAERYLGVFGFWLVIIAAIFSMLSALSANLLGSSRMAFSMSRDRTLPKTLSVIIKSTNIPLYAILVTSAVVVFLIIIIPDVANAGAAASLIFLVTFALTNFIGILVRKRIDESRIPFKVPFFPYLHITAVVTSLSLAIFEGIAVPVAGLITLSWLVLGAFLYVVLFSRRARIFDALSESLDPQLVKLRGRSQRVLVPIANPTNAASMVRLASSLVPEIYGRVLLLSVVTPVSEWKKGESPAQLVNSQKVLKEALTASFAEGLFPEALTTVAVDVWEEIERVAKQYHCTSLLVGLTNLSESVEGKNLERLINSVNCDVVVLRVPTGWNFSKIRKVLVPVGGKGMHGELLARLLGSLYRTANPEVDFIKVVPEETSWAEREKARNELFGFAQDQVLGSNYKIRVIENNDPGEEIISQSINYDLLILGLQRTGKRSAFGDLAIKVARKTSTPLILISHNY